MRVCLFVFLFVFVQVIESHSYVAGEFVEYLENLSDVQDVILTADEDMFEICEKRNDIVNSLLFGLKSENVERLKELHFFSLCKEFYDRDGPLKCGQNTSVDYIHQNDGFVTGITFNEQEYFSYLETSNSYRELQQTTVGDWTRNVDTKVLVVRAVPKDGLSLTLTSSFLDKVFEQVNAFYLENSAGQQSFSYTLYDKVIKTSYYTYNLNQGGGSQYSCVGGGYLPKSDDIANDVIQQITRTFADKFQRIVISLGHCKILNYGGLGQLRGPISWINGYEQDIDNFAKLLAHEFGHNNGAQHAEHEELEYGNDFSIMGNGVLPSGHFSIGAKVDFGWVNPNTQIKSFDAHQMCSVGENCLESGTFWLEAHDSGIYAPNKIYGFKIYTKQKNQYLWVEFREKYEQLEEPGPLIVWALNGGSSLYGPTQLIDYVRSTKTQRDASVPLGFSYTFDIGGSNIIISTVDKSEKRIKVHVRFLKEQQEADLFDFEENSLKTLECGETLEINKPGNHLLRFPLEHSAEITFDQICEQGIETSSDEDAGIYLYPRFPLHFYLEENFDTDNQILPLDFSKENIFSPGIGAVFMSRFSSGCEKKHCNVLIDKFVPGYFDGEWKHNEGMFQNGMPVYQFGSFNFIFVPQKEIHVDGQTISRDAWVVTTQNLEKPTKVYGLVVPKIMQQNKVSLGEIESQFDYAMYSGQNGWVKRPLSTFACYKEVKQAHISDRYTSSVEDVSYREFTNENYLMVYGLTKSIQITPHCKTKYCSANHYFDAGYDACFECPDSTISPPNSKGRDSCYKPCENIVLTSKAESTIALNADGIYQFHENVNGVPSFALFGEQVRDSNWYIYKIGSEWVLNQYLGATWYRKVLSKKNEKHPMAFSADSSSDFQIQCACDIGNLLLPECESTCEDENYIIEPTRPQECFLPCSNLNIIVFDPIFQQFLSGEYKFLKFTDSDAKPVFRSDELKSELWGTSAGWYIGPKHEQGSYYKKSVDYEGEFWPTTEGKSVWADSTPVQISCVEDGLLVDIFSLLKMKKETPTPTKTPTEKPTLPPSKKPATPNHPTTKPSKKPITSNPTTISKPPTTTTTKTNDPTTTPTTKPTRDKKTPKKTQSPTSSPSMTLSSSNSLHDVEENSNSITKYEKEEKSGSGAAAGITITVLLIITGSVGGIWYYRYRRNRQPDFDTSQLAISIGGTQNLQEESSDDDDDEEDEEEITCEIEKL